MENLIKYFDEHGYRDTITADDRNEEIVKSDQQGPPATGETCSTGK